MYFSDHGYMTGQHDLWCKNVLFEEATSVPFIVRVPGSSKNGTQCDDIVELVDIFPSLIDYFELPKLPYEIDGESLRPLIDKECNQKRMKKNAYCAINYGKTSRYHIVGVRYKNRDNDK